MLLFQRRRSVTTLVNIMGLPPNTRRDDLWDKFSEFGPMISLQVTQAENGKQSIANATFRNYDSAITMVDELHESILMGRKIRVMFSKKIDSPLSGSKLPAKPQLDETKSLIKRLKEDARYQY